MRNESAPAAGADREIARLAARQHGVLTHRQLCEAGLSPSGIVRRKSAGRLHRVHHGVYAVGHRAPSTLARWHAAVLAVGPGAVLSHRSAAELWKLLEPLDSGSVHVTLPGRVGRVRRSGIRIHRPRVFDETLATRRQGIPVTTISRTLFDLRGSVPHAVVRRAVRQAEYLAVLPDDQVTDHTRSDLERAFLRICRDRRLRLPEVNARVGSFTVDFLWREEGVVIEVDGYSAHRGRQAFRDDRDRDLELSARGLAVHRIADTRIADDPQGVGALTAGLLRAAGRRGGK